MSRFEKYLFFTNLVVGGANFALWVGGLGSSKNLVAVFLCAVAAGWSVPLKRADR